MQGIARVSSIDALKEFRAGLLKFKAEATSALIETEAEIQRTLVWLQHDQTQYWHRQVRIRQELLTRAKTDLYRKQVAQDKQIRVSVDQKKAVEKAKRQLAEAEEKVQVVKRWIQQLDKELIMYKGETQSLSGMLDGDLPNGVKRLDGMIAALQSYVVLGAPSGDGGEKAAEDPAGTPEEGKVADERHGGAHDAPGLDEGSDDALGPGQAELGR